MGSGQGGPVKKPCIDGATHIWGHTVEVSNKSLEMDEFLAGAEVGTIETTGGVIC